MRKTILIFLIFVSACFGLQAHRIRKMKSEYNPEDGNYTIKFNLVHYGIDYHIKDHLLELTASLKQKQYKKLKFLYGTNIHDAVQMGKGLEIIWNPEKEGLPVGKWKFKLKAKPYDFCFVEGGTFMMGESDTSADAKFHEVTVSSFWMGKYEVTVEEYKEYMGWVRFDPSDCFPARYISWYDAVTYCNKRSIAEGLTPCYSGSGDDTICDWDADGYRLPTEAEWEYAARGGNKSKGYKYAGSNDINKVASYEANSYANDIGRPTELQFVGCFLPNELGIYDMSGGATEWCWDYYGLSYYEESPKLNPRGPDSGVSRVFRGGSSYEIAFYCAVGYRYLYSPSHRGQGFGFRVVRAVR